MCCVWLSISYSLPTTTYQLTFPRATISGMKKRIGKIIASIAGLYFAATPVMAATLDQLGGPDGDVATIGSLEILFKNIVNVVIALAAVALFLMFIVGGFTFLFSGGDQKKLEQARGTLSNAVIGLVVIVGAYLILRIIGSFTGTLDTITTFKIMQ